MDRNGTHNSQLDASGQLIGQPLFWVFAALFVVADIRAIIPGRSGAQENLRPPGARRL
jgi:hypothetical protein